MLAAINDPAMLDEVFAALSSPVRRHILNYLGEHGAATVTEIAAPLPLSLNAVSKHLKVLEHAGLIRREIRGREHYCALNTQPIDRAIAWLDYYRAFWTERLNAMEALFARHAPDPQE